MDPLQPDIKFCEICGSSLHGQEVEGKMRPRCGNCGRVVFLDPKLAAVVLVTIDGRVVLIKRGVEPAMGEWAFPSGYVDRGEAVEQGAEREVLEETGLHVKVENLVGLYSSEGSTVVLAVYSARVTGGNLRAGHDAQDVGLFDLDNLPPLPFPHDEAILRDWNNARDASY